MKHHVLVVDDNPEIRSLIIATLGETFYKLGEAANGQQTFAYLNANDYPDLMILDLAMPDVSGLEILEEVKNDPETTHIEIIVLSANADSAAQDRAIKMGAHSVITKPFSPLDLLQRVEALFT
jgi:CheY-like chemotaxis protein